MNNLYTHQRNIRFRHFFSSACVVLAGMWSVLPATLKAQHVASIQVSAQADVPKPKPVATISLEEALKRIEQKHHVTFLYRTDVVTGKSVPNEADQAVTLSSQLEKVLKPFGLKHRQIREDYFVIIPKHQSSGNRNGENTKLLSTDPSLPGTGSVLVTPTSPIERIAREIRGRVTNREKEGLPGVSVLVKGTTIGTATDSEGSYALNLTDDQTNGILVFSFIGYVTEEVAIGDRSAIDVVLVQDVKTLSEVVVVGYGTQKRKDVTGAISTVDTKELESIPVTNVGQALQGRAAGVTVMQNDGNPGSGLLVQVRGAGSVNSIQPLFVIDGVIGAGGENYINPGDIESIQVLKDASASAIYGSRAANGVVLITTKRGKAGKPRVSFDSYYGIQNVWKKIDVLNARQYADYANELQANGGQPPIPALQNPETLVDRTDWQDEIFRTAPIQNYNVGVSGGSENATFNVKAGYFNQEGILLRTGFDRYSLRINSDFRVGKFKFGESLNLAKTTNRGSTPEALAQSIAMPTYIPVYNPSTPGQFAGPNVEDGMDAKNPVRILTLNDTRTDGYSLIGNAFMDYEIIKNLVYRFSGGLSFEVSDYSSYTPAYSAGERDVAPFANLNQSNARNLTPLIENTLTYSNSFGEHTITALAGYTRQWFNGKYTSAGIRNFISPDVQVINGGTEIQNLTGNVQEWSLVSFLARVSYDYRGKYLLTTNFRRDGSSRFAPGNKYGVFPSFSVGWRAGQEAFLSDVGWLSDLKFRFGWGQIGNQDPYNGGNNYPYQATLNANGNYILGSGQQKVPAITQTAVANANISWETSVQTNFGADLGLWKNKLTLNADYYVKKTQDMLIGLPIPVSSGLGGEPTFNSGAAVNTGFEVSGTLNQTIGAFTFSLGANMGYLLRNEVTSLGDRSQPLLIDALIVQRTLPGQSMGHFYGYRVDRIYQIKEEIDADNAVAAENGKGYYQGANTAPGDIRFKDLNGDGTVNADDREVIGNPIPKLTYGATLGMGYKGFDLSLMLQGMGGYDVFNFYNAYWNESMSRAFNTTTAVLDRWTRSNPSTTFPRAVANDPNGNARGSDRWIENGSFMRVKNLTIGYALPAGLLGAFIKGSVSSLRIYATSQNLLTFSDNSFWDPEFASGGSSINYRGIAGSVYPQARTFLVGIQAGF